MAKRSFWGTRSPARGRSSEGSWSWSAPGGAAAAWPGRPQPSSRSHLAVTHTAGCTLDDTVARGWETKGVGAARVFLLTHASARHRAPASGPPGHRRPLPQEPGAPRPFACRSRLIPTTTLSSPHRTEAGLTCGPADKDLVLPNDRPASVGPTGQVSPDRLGGSVYLGWGWGQPRRTAFHLPPVWTASALGCLCVVGVPTQVPGAGLWSGPSHPATTSSPSRGRTLHGQVRSQPLE